MSEIQPVLMKYRCTSITRSYDGHHTARLVPVMPSETEPENKVFWKWTPSGEAEIAFGKRWTWKKVPGAKDERVLTDYDQTFEEGSCYKLTIVPRQETDPDPWQFVSCLLHSSQLGVEFDRKEGKGKLKMSTINPPAIRNLLDAFYSNLQSNLDSGQSKDLWVTIEVQKA